MRNRREKNNTVPATSVKLNLYVCHYGQLTDLLCRHFHLFMLGLLVSSRAVVELSIWVS